MDEKPLGKWTFEQLVSQATWQIIAEITKGTPLRSAVSVALDLAIRWSKEKEQQYMWQGQVGRQAEELMRLRTALHCAEAALADIGDADREPGDDLAWCESRAAEALPTVRAAMQAQKEKQE